MIEILASNREFGHFTGFKEQFEFFEFCYELELANHAKKNF
jgi:hypothetical protein